MRWISLQLGWTSIDVIAIQILIGCAAAVGAIVISSVASFKTVQVASSVKRLRGSLISKQISIFCQWWSSIPMWTHKSSSGKECESSKGDGEELHVEIWYLNVKENLSHLYAFALSPVFFYDGRPQSPLFRVCLHRCEKHRNNTFFYSINHCFWR